MTDARPFTLKPLPLAEYRLGKVLCKMQDSYRFPLDGETVTATPRRVSHETANWQIDIELSGLPCRLFTGNRIMDHLLPDRLDHRVVNKLPMELTLALFGNRIKPLIDAVSQSTGHSIQLTGVKRTKKVGVPVIDLEIETGGLRDRVQLEISGRLTEALTHLPTRPVSEFPDIPFLVSLVRGKCVLTTREMGQLEIGDVVFLDQQVMEPRTILHVSNRLAWLGTIEYNSITITQRIQIMDEFDSPIDDQHPAFPDHPTDTEFEALPHGPLDLDELPVTLLFEVGTQQMTYAELQALAEGHVFQLNNPLDSPVRIRANGKPVGECQLVEIEGRLGARITRLTGRRNPEQ